MDVRRMLRVSVEVLLRSSWYSIEFPRDNAFGRIMMTQLPDNQNVTVQSCIASCDAQNFTLAGLEYSVQCCEYSAIHVHDRKLISRCI